MITTFLKASPAVIVPNTPIIPPSTSTTSTQPTSADLQPSTGPAAEEQAPKEITYISNGRKDESCSRNFRDTTEEAKEKEEARVTSADKAEALADDAVVFVPNTDDPSDSHATPKAYATKFFHKLTEAEKWELEHDLLNSMLNNA
jgi:hypothetical protein